MMARASVILLSILVLFPAAVAQCAAPFVTVVLTGDSAVGGRGGSFTSIDSFVVNTDGDVAFEAGVDFTADGIWRWRGGALELVALEGADAPGTDEDFASFLSKRIDDDGRVAFYADTATDSGLWEGLPGSVMAIVLESEPAPVIVGEFTDFPVEFAWTDGRVSFEGSVLVDEEGEFVSRSVLWTGAPGELTVLALEGAPSPIVGQDYLFFSDPLLLNRAASNAFTFRATDAAIALGMPGDLDVIVQGDALPGFPMNWTSPRLDGLDAEGQIIFAASYFDGMSTTAGIWAGPVDAPTKVAIEGDVAPGVPGATIRDFGSTSVNSAIAGDGQLVFRANLDGVPAESRGAIYGGAIGAVELLVQEGTQAPGVENGVVFSDFSDSDEVYINASGVVAFVSDVDGPSVGSSNDIGLFAGTPGELELVVREGEALTVRPGVTKTVRRVELEVSGVASEESAGTGDGRANPLNDRNQLVARVEFSDFSEGLLLFEVAGGEPTLFEDDFESGGTSKWDARVP